MTRARGLQIAMHLLAVHGLDGWTVCWSNAQRTFGQCDHRRRVILVSWPIARLNDEQTFRATVMHEIAHALAGPTGHGAAWRRVCAQLGIDDARCVDPTQVRMPPPKWIGRCPTCGWQTTRVQLRRSARNGSCPRCDHRHNSDHLIQWRRADGQTTA